MLVSATYDSRGVPTLALTFDRAIDISGLDGSQITVIDGDNTGFIYDGHSALLLDPVTVQISLGQIGPTFNLGVRLTASATTGIVAVDDGGTWPGVTNLSLPFP